MRKSHLSVFSAPLKNFFSLGVIIAAASLPAAATVHAEDYYKEEPQFHAWPKPDAARYKIERFGPIGIGLELRQPAFTMHIVNIEEGSPAAAARALKKGQIIESVNGHVMKDEDPRVLLGNWITEAEAKGGIVKLMVKDKPGAAAREVVVHIPALGAYSPTWPVDCEKTDKIVRNHADALAAHIDSVNIDLNGAVLFMLSTGEEKDLEVVRGWMKNFVENYKKPDEGRETYPWFAGYTGPGFCEYYLRTGDKSVLPVIKDMADSLSRTIYNGSWMGRGGASYQYMGGGHLNAAGLHAVTFLLLARECGVEVDEHTLQTSLHHVYRFAGHGNVAYGDHLPEQGFTANGKTEGLAFTMQAAANLHPDGENSIYARARDVSANKAFYNSSWLFHGHTGGGIGELWKGRAMGLVRDKRPGPYRSFMDERRWMYELARTHEGVFGWVSDWNVGYTDTALESRGWGAFIPLIYTLPRKALRLHGAPPTKYSHTHNIPDRPWGNEADEIFLSLEPGEYRPGKRQDISEERLPTDASKPVLQRISDPAVSDEVLLMYAYHFDHGIRTATARAINRHGRDHLVLELLQSSDPRARLAGITCINGMKKGTALPDEKLVPEMFERIGAMIDDPDESWFVMMGAMEAMQRAQPEMIARHFDTMLPWLDHHDWWLRQAAMRGLTPLATDPNYYKALLSRVGQVIQTSQRLGDFDALDNLTQQLDGADPRIREFAVDVLGKTYLNYPEELVEPGGQDLTKNIDLLLDGFAKDLAKVPGGYDAIYELARMRNPDQALPHEELFLRADPAKFGPKLKKAIEPTIKNRLIPEYIEQNRKRLEGELSSRKPGRAVEGLVDLYNKVDNHDYDWQLYGPERDKIVWDYTTFDPPEVKIWEAGHRFRKITFPQGSENWFKPDFDPAVTNGWKTGRAPFANNGGKPEPLGRCEGPHHFCGCGNPVNTFWDKEVLLLRAKLELPPLRDGYAYRLMVGGRSHYNLGGGSDVWIDGDHLDNRRKNRATFQGGSGRNSYRPFSHTIEDEDRVHFEDGKILMAANGFLRWGHRSKEIKAYKTFWFEAMKLPELPEPTE